MHDSPAVFLMLLILVGVFGAMALVAGIRLRPTPFSPGIALVSVLPALAMLGLFYSLAIHMQRSLGGWPESIGRSGFPPPLIAHADLASLSFSALLLVAILAWPTACVLSASIRRWRGALLYLGIFALSSALCFAAMMLAPSQFLYWWWD
jgi:hypothetical protein